MRQVWGWHVLTGDYCFRMTYSDGEWRRMDFEASFGKDGVTEGAFRSTSEKYTRLLRSTRRGCTH